MGRRRQSNYDGPPRFHKKGKVWHHVGGTLPRLWTKLSSDCVEALRLWVQRESVPEAESTKLFSVVAKRYVRDVYPGKSVQTRKDNDKELANLLKVFAHVPIDAIAPMHIREYMDIRGQVAKVRANREKALFSLLSSLFSLLSSLFSLLSPLQQGSRMGVHSNAKSLSGG